jgi:light-regulated signal transduction histidine kinase (bacteriophytochrome)
VKEKEELRIYYDISTSKIKELETILFKKSEKNRNLKRQLETTIEELRKLELERQVLSHDLQNTHNNFERMSELLKESEEKNQMFTKDLAFRVI